MIDPLWEAVFRDKDVIRQCAEQIAREVADSGDVPGDELEAWSRMVVMGLAPIWRKRYQELLREYDEQSRG